MYDIAVLGNAAVDALTNVSEEFMVENGLKKGDFHLKSFDDFMRINNACEVEKFESGGSVANTAYAMARIGSRVAFIGRVGADASGRHFRKEMLDVGVTMPELDNHCRTMEIFVLITPDGQRSFVTSGVTAPVLPEMVPEEIIAQSKWLLIEGYLLLDQMPAVDRAIELARKHDVKIALTLASFAVLEKCYREIAAEIRKGMHLIVANKEEMDTLRHAIETHMDGEAEQVATRLRATSRMITDGSKGAVYINGDKEILVTTDPVAHPVDTTGAGDAFAGGFLHKYIAGEPVREAIELGHSLAGRVILRTGARLKMEEFAEIKRAVGA